MDSFEINKIIAAILVTFLIIFGIGKISDIVFKVDKLDDNPNKVRLFSLRSFGESLYHSITDASLEFGFKTL